MIQAVSSPPSPSPGPGPGVRLLACLVLTATLAGAQQEPPACSIDLSLPGPMSDIVSNALTRGLDQPGLDVRAFLEGAHERFESGSALRDAAAAHFGLAPELLAEQVEAYRHCNCRHEGGGAAAEGDGADQRDAPVVPVRSHTDAMGFARDVLVHVVLHEIGHALVREFDLPVLANEETLADAFATHYLTSQLPERAPAVLRARLASLMVEAGEVPRAQWPVSGEHDSDARRAHQIAALAVAADPGRYEPLARELGLSDDELKAARDYGSEVHRSWRRLLAPLWMPAGQPSTETRLRRDPSDSVFDELLADGLDAELLAVLQRFDWHSQVTLSFEQGDGGAGWSRGRRTISVHGGYAERFLRQGALLQGDG